MKKRGETFLGSVVVYHVPVHTENFAHTFCTPLLGNHGYHSNGDDITMATVAMVMPCRKCAEFSVCRGTWYTTYTDPAYIFHAPRIFSQSPGLRAHFSVDPSPTLAHFLTPTRISNGINSE